MLVFGYYKVIYNSITAVPVFLFHGITGQNE